MSSEAQSKSHDIETYETAMEIAWQFDYEIGIDKLRSLYSKSKKQQWDGEADLDWSIEVDPSKPLIDDDRFGLSEMPFVKRLSKSQQETFRAHVGAQRLSQFLHGEQGALMTAATLTHAVPDYEGKLYAATQTMDEARHVEVFERYLRKLAVIYPMSPFLRELIDTTLKSESWIKVAIGMNMIVEGLALGAFHNMRRATSCSLLRSLLEGVLRDESRHVAFGNVYVGKTIAELHPDDREDVAEFAFEALMLMVRSTGRQTGKPPAPDPTFRLVLENSEIDPADFLAGMMEAREQGIEFEQPPGTVHAFKDLMMPALARVGAITDRTREKFADEGIRIFEDLSVLEAMEDDETGSIEIG
ncbi:MAG: ferritin-like domain-containing protein [Deltaproteobacteria bacterium]|nr:ferritin-like domain-containing protein [Deltaproteobacteria bacterium]